MHELPKHRTDQRHLHHHPLDRVETGRCFLWQEPAGLFRQIEEDRARFEHGIGLPALAVVIDDDRDLGIRIELQEFRIELRLAENIDGMHGIGQPHFLEGNVDLDDVRAAHGVEVDHRELRVSVALSRACHDRGPGASRRSPLHSDTRPTCELRRGPSFRLNGREATGEPR
jgi:hypothetical protein